MNWKKNLILLVSLFAGALVGSLLAAVTRDLPLLGLLSYGDSIGIDAAHPFVLDLSVLQLSVAFELRLNLAQILCMIGSIVLYKRMVSRL